MASSQKDGQELDRTHDRQAELHAEGALFLEHQMSEMNFSPRAHDRILKVAARWLTSAGREKIACDDVMEAVQYRTLDRKLWV